MASDRNASAPPEVDELSDSWNVRDATLLRGEGSLDQTTRFERNSSPAVLKAALDRAARTVRETPPNRDRYAVPLHETENPTATDEYVLWRPDSEQVGWYDTSFGIDGTVRFVSVETASETTIGDRLVFWHPELTPESDEELANFELPESDVRPNSKLSERERQAFFEELFELVESERDRRVGTGRRTAREPGPRASRPRRRLGDARRRVTESNAGEQLRRRLRRTQTGTEARRSSGRRPLSDGLDAR